MSRFSLKAIFALLLMASYGCASPIVGGECSEGFSACSRLCVDLMSDPSHCGACGVMCGASQVCSMGECVTDDGGGVDGGGSDGGDDSGVDGGGSDGGDDGGVDGGGSDGGGSDGGSGVCPCGPGEICCGLVCVDPDSDPLHCGTCDNACGPMEFCALGVCRDSCLAPLRRCGALCLDVRTDPDNCGSCGRGCESGICIGGMCSGAFPGHLVVIGHDYRRSRTGQNYVAGNSVILLSNSDPLDPIEVVVYEGDATTESMRGVDAAIDQVAMARGREWERIPASTSEFTGYLDTADVALVYHQAGATDASLSALSSLWASALRPYLERGGVVVVFEGAASHGGTHQVLAGAGLMPTSPLMSVEGLNLDVVRRFDVVALSVPDPYRGEVSTVAFTGASLADAVVSHIGSGSPAPVVLHSVF